MASVLDLVKHYQHTIEKYPNDEQKVLKSIDKLFALGVTVQHLQETGVGRTVNALRKEPGDVGQAARALVYKWKVMVAAEESDQEADQNNDTTNCNGYGNGRDSDDNAKRSRSRHNTSERSSKSDQNSLTQMNGNTSGSKRKYHSSEEEENSNKKSKQSSSSETDDQKHSVRVKQEQPESDEHHDSEDSHSSDSESGMSESSEDDRNVNRKIKIEPTERSKSGTTKHSSHNHVEHKKESSSSSKQSSSSNKDTKIHNSESRNTSDKSSSRQRSQSSHKHKSSTHKDSSESKHKSDHSKDKARKKDVDVSDKVRSSSEKHRSSSEKPSSQSEKLSSSSDSHTKSSSQKDNKSVKHKEKYDKNEKRESKSDKHSSQAHKSDKEKSSSKSSSDKDAKKHKSRESSSSSKEKVSSSSKDKLKDSSSKKSSDNHKSEKKSSSHEGKSRSDDKDKKNKSDDRSCEKKSKNKSSSSSSHKSEKSSSKEGVPKTKPHIDNSVDSDDGIDCGSGASFAEALGMVSPAKPKKKSISIKEMSSPNSFNNDLSPAALLAPSAKLAPLPALEISALPEISPNYRPRPPPRLLPHFTDDEAMSAVISSKNQRTKVYSGNKVIGKIPTLYELCVHVLQEHIDESMLIHENVVFDVQNGKVHIFPVHYNAVSWRALEFTGGVPYEILKPIVDKATPQQLFMLEYHNPYLTEDTDHLWKAFCEKHFRNKKREEMEAWREMYMRCQEEQEDKLKSLTANIRMTQEAKKAPIKQTKMAYVDSVVKPPRNIARKQAQHGTAFSSSASPAARVAALASAPNVLRGGARPAAAPLPGAAAFKPKKAPLMAKALQFMRGRKR